MRATDERAQASVELALLLPLVALLLATVVQVGLVARDRVVVVAAARAAARALAVEPDEAAAVRAVESAVGADRRFGVAVHGRPTAGAVMTVTVTARPMAVPLVGRLVSNVELTERLAVRIEGR
ncbi:MAG: pilus assembly protein [Actinobacteria bacterium]|nr:pilus assembly protein [Actinomycetota bacterium]